MDPTPSWFVPNITHGSPITMTEQSLVCIEVETQKDDGWHYQDGTKAWHGPFETAEAAQVDRGLEPGWYYVDRKGMHGPYSLDEARDKARKVYADQEVEGTALTEVNPRRMNYSV